MKPSPSTLLLTILLAALTAALPSLAATDSDDNIHISGSKTVMRYNADKNGVLTSIDIDETITYSARRTQGKAIAITTYDDNTKLNKAKSSAKGTKTLYKQAIDDVFYTDMKYCMMEMPVSPDKDVVVRFERHNSMPRHSGLTMLSDVYDIDELTITYIMPIALKDRITIESVNLPDDHSVTSEETKPGKEWTVTYTLRHIPAIKAEDGAPSSRHYAPMLRELGLFDNVGDLYTYLHGFTVHPDPAHEQVTELAMKLTEGLSDPMAKISAINDWVHDNIRYISVEHGEWGQRPDSPSEVIRKRYGDCKGSASLTKALLREAGIDARLVWIGTTSIPERWDEVPLMSTGNHMISCVMLPGHEEPLFLDGTASYCPAGMIPYGIDGKQALIEDGDSYRLALVPQINPREHTDSLTLRLVLNDSLRLTGNLTSSRTGLSDCIVRNRLKNLTGSERSKFIERIAKAGRKSIKVTDTAADSAGVITATVNASDLISQLDERILIDTGMLLSMRDNLTCNMTERTAPFEVIRPCTKTETFIISLPPQSTVELPPNAILDTPWVEGSLSYGVDGDTITATATYISKGGIVPLESLSDFNVKIRKFASAVAANIILIRK